MVHDRSTNILLGLLTQTCPLAPLAPLLLHARESNNKDSRPTAATMRLEPPGHFCEGTHYLLRGPTSSEELVVLIHGMRTYHGCLNRLATVLAENGFLTLQYDMLGRGFTELPADGKYGELEHVGQLFDLIERLGLMKRLHVIGHSQGAAVGLTFSSMYWRMIASLTLLAPSGLSNSLSLGLVRHGPLVRMLARSVQRGHAGREKAWRSDFHSHTGDALSIENETVEELHALYDQRPEVFEGFWNTLMQFPMNDIDRHISQVGENPELNVFLLWGKEDKSIPFIPNYHNWCEKFSHTHCRFMAKAVEEAGHSFFLEKHAEVNQDILAFLLSVRRV